MNVFKKVYCRVFQFFCRLAIPLLPYREPRLIKDYNDLIAVMQKADKHKPLIVTDSVLHRIGICDAMLKTFKDSAISFVMFDGTVANPTTENVAAAVDLYRTNACDCLVAIGGGSSMDCAKAVGACIVRPDKTLGQMKELLKVPGVCPCFLQYRQLQVRAAKLQWRQS